MVSREEIANHHESMLLDFIRAIKADDDLTAMFLIAVRDSRRGVTVEVHAGGSTYNIYRAAATLLESVLKPGRRSGGIMGILEAKKVKALADSIMELAGNESSDVVELDYEDDLENLKRK
jgi:hypothetical protein